MMTMKTRCALVPAARALAFTFALAFTCAFACAGRASAAAPQGPQRPANPADSVPVAADDNGACETTADRIMGMLSTVGDSCVTKFLDNRLDYAWIMAHVLAEFWVPGADAWVAGELMKKVGKDAAMCILTGLVRAGAGSPEAKAVAVAAIEEVRETIDRKEMLGKANAAWDTYAEHGRQYLMTKNDHAKFVTYLDKKAFDRLKNTKKDVALVEAVANMNDPTRKARDLRETAARELESCKLTEAATSIQASQELYVSWLTQVRQHRSKLKKRVRCLQTERDEARTAGPEYADIQPAWLAAVSQSLEDARFDEEAYARHDETAASGLREVANLAASIENKTRIVEDTLRKPFAEKAAAAERALAECATANAERLIGELSAYTNGPDCSSELKHEYYRELELQGELVRRVDDKAAQERKVIEIFERAMMLPREGSCEALRAEASFLEKATHGTCVDDVNAYAKVVTLRNMADNCATPFGPKQEGAKDYNGTWNTSYGTMTLTQAGRSVSGSSDYYDTKLEGTIDAEGVLQCNWVTTYTDGRVKKGKCRFELFGDSFTGGYSDTMSDGTQGGGGGWGGTRITK
jgi:hypothetical protein